jgi:hypothetical protein
MFYRLDDNLLGDLDVYYLGKVWRVVVAHPTTNIPLDMKKMVGHSVWKEFV